MDKSTPVSTTPHEISNLSKTDIDPDPTITTSPDSTMISERNLGTNKAFPLSIRYTEKFNLLRNGTWRLKQQPATSPRAVELLSAEGASKFNIDGALTDNSTVQQGQPVPKEIIAVVRRSRTSKENDHTEMNLEVKILDFTPAGEEVPSAAGTKAAGAAAAVVARASARQDARGLYCFRTAGNELEHLFRQMGTYMFQFSLDDHSLPPAVVRVNVAPSNTNLCEAHSLARSRALLRRKRSRSKHAPGSVEGSFDTAASVIRDEVEEDFGPEPKQDITQIHVTSLDAIISVNGFFAIAVFLGLGLSPPLPQNQAATTLAPARLECYVQINVYRAVVLWEVVSFGCFLFSTLVGHGFKLYIVLQIGKNRGNAKTAAVDQNFLRAGILSAGIGSILGAIFLIVSMVVLIEVRLGDLTCHGNRHGNSWAMSTTISFLFLGVSGCLIFIVAVFYEAIRTYSVVVVQKISESM